ncbi:MAG: class II aldolase/adducin family protein [Bacteroidales bacterium]|nr:class II aldolase/adducin family protein [Bacteroidales bacterium]
MAEIYTGTKFFYIQKMKRISLHPHIVLLKKWCGIFNRYDFAPLYPGGSSGNLSFRTKLNSDVFIITAGRTALNHSMLHTDFSEVISCNINKNTVVANGLKAPSSETLMHGLIYKNRSDINAVFHGHSKHIMKRAKENGFPETKTELPYGTIELAEDTLNTLKKYNFVILKNHGFISVGKTQEEAGTFVLSLLSNK